MFSPLSLIVAGVFALTGATAPSAVPPPSDPIPAASNVLPSTGVIHAVVVLVNDPECAARDADPLVCRPSTSAAIDKDIFGAKAPSLASYWSETSGARLSLVGTTTKWHTVSHDWRTEYCAGRTGDQDLVSMIDPLVDLTGVDMIFLVTPNGSCGAQATATGVHSFVTSKGTIRAGFAILWAGDAADDPWAYVRVSAEEGGHLLGLAEAGRYDYDGSSMTMGPIGCLVDHTCGTFVQYGDRFSAMGGGLALVPWRYNAYEQANLGWLTPQTVTKDGTFTVAPFEGASGIRALRIYRGTSPAGNDEYLWLEDRTKTGEYDSQNPMLSLDKMNIWSGALLHQEIYKDQPWSLLVDATPVTASTLPQNDALEIGQTMSDPFGTVSITVLSRETDGSLKIKVAYGFAACVRGTPMVSSPSPYQSNVEPGGSVATHLTVSNRDTKECAAAGFEVSSPDAKAITQISLLPGASADVALTLLAPPNVEGISGYTVTVRRSGTAADGPSSMTRGVLNVLSPCPRGVPVISVVHKPATVTSAKTISILISVTNKDDAACPAATFTLTISPTKTGVFVASIPTTITLAAGTTKTIRVHVKVTTSLVTRSARFMVSVARLSLGEATTANFSITYHVGTAYTLDTLKRSILSNLLTR